MDTLCRVCIDKATKCTLLNTKIEDSSNLTFFDFLNKCTSLNACKNDKLPQSLCSVCTHSIETFYSFVKLAEKSNLILREALNSITTGKYSDNREISCEEITITNDKIEEESEDCNKENLFYRQTNASATESSFYILDIVKEEPHLSQSPLVAVKLNDEFYSNLDHRQRSVEEPDDILSSLASHLAGIHADYSYSEDDVSVSLSSEDETSQSNFFPKVHCISSNVKKKTGKLKAKRKQIIKEGASDPQSIWWSDHLNDSRDFSCEEIAITNEEMEENTNSTLSSLYSADILKEEPRISESISAIAKINESDEFHSNLDHPEGSIEPDNILTSIDGHLANNGAEHSVTDDDVPISILKRRLVKHKKPDSQKMEVESSYKCEGCDMVFNDKAEFRTHFRNHVCEDKLDCNICGKKFVKRRYLQIHLQTQHLKRGHKCSICGKNFKCPSNLRRHMGVHGGPRSPPPKMFECEICSKKFTGKYNLKRHMEIHSGIIRKCDQCDKEYKYTEALRRHKKWHTNPKPFKCENCGKLFANKFNYTYHVAICK